MNARMSLFVMVALTTVLGSPRVSLADSIDIQESEAAVSGGWRCIARSQGYDKHGEHSWTGSTQAEASNSTRQVCDLSHFPGACRVEKCYSISNDEFEGSIDSGVLSEADSTLGYGEYVNCSSFVKPALCVSHSECTWNGNCVRRR